MNRITHGHCGVPVLAAGIGAGSRAQNACNMPAVQRRRNSDQKLRLELVPALHIGVY